MKRRLPPYKPRDKAPDGHPYPPPIVAVSQEEQIPYTWGFAQAAERAASMLGTLMVIAARYRIPA